MSESITTSIHAITSISLAVLVVSAVSISVFVINDSFQQKSQQQASLVLSDLTILQVGFIESTSIDFNVFVKNTGERSLGNLESLSIFYDGQIVQFNSSDTSILRYTFTRIDVKYIDKPWNAHETVMIGLQLPEPEEVGTGQHKIVVIAENGATIDTYVFSV